MPQWFFSKRLERLVGFKSNVPGQRAPIDTPPIRFLILLVPLVIGRRDKKRSTPRDTDFHDFIECIDPELYPGKFLLCLGHPTGKYAERPRRRNAPLDTEWHLSYNNHQKFHTCIVPASGFSPSSESYHTTLGSDFGQIWRAENVHHKKSDAVVSAGRKLDRRAIPRQTLYYIQLRKFSPAEVALIHPGLPIRVPAPVNPKYSSARDPESYTRPILSDYATSRLNLDPTGVPLPPL